MKRRKSLMIIFILLWGLFFISGCGDGIPEGTLNTTGATVALDAGTGNSGLAAGMSCILTATLTDKSVTCTAPGKCTASAQPLSGQVITFAFFSNESGATLIPLNGGVTDSVGKAYAVYTAGTLKTGLTIQDIVQAHISGYSGQVVILRTGGKATGIRLTVSAAPTDVFTGQNSVITAKATDLDQKEISGLVVTFSFVTNNSGGSLSNMTAVTDADGEAVTTYTAGDSSPGTSVSDTIQASASGSVDAVVVTRKVDDNTTGAGPRFNTIPLAAVPAALTSSSGTSVITASVVRGSLTTSQPAAGETVTFAIITGGGSIAPQTAVTDNGGLARVIFTGPGGAAGAALVRARITSATGGGEAFITITWP